MTSSNKLCPNPCRASKELDYLAKFDMLLWMVGLSEMSAARPHADAFSVEDLVQKFVDGKVRVPDFQRQLRWEGKDVVRLLDSVRRGFPIGSLLMWQRKGEEGHVKLGPFDFPVESRHDAWHVVDGQQRLTSLAATLRHPRPDDHSAASSTFLCWYDLKKEQFFERGGNVPTQVPVHRLFDAVDLAEWLAENDLGKELARKAHEVGKALREYRVPVYVIETEDKAMLIEVFERTNNFGKSLTQTEVFDALVGTATDNPRRVQDLVEELSRVSMGSPNQTLALRLILTLAGLDPWTTFKDLSSAQREGLREVIPKVIAPGRQAMEFLRDEAEVPHLRLLPRSWPLIAVTRFFAKFPTPSSRSISLLGRWLWRGVIAGSGSSDEKTMLRRAVRSVEEGTPEHEVVQRWLEIVPTSADALSPVAVPARSGARTSAFRVVMAALASLGPRDAETGRLIDVASILERHGTQAFARLVGDGDALSTIGNRVLHEPRPGLCELIRASAPEVRSSHAFPIAVDGEPDDFPQVREERVRQIVDCCVERVTAFGFGDRPDVELVLRAADSANSR